LKHPDTPYLFACMMFTHVEHIRKTAVKRMSGMYKAPADSYDLSRLVDVLCFEDEAEVSERSERALMKTRDNQLN